MFTNDFCKKVEPPINKTYEIDLFHKEILNNHSIHTLKKEKSPFTDYLSILQNLSKRDFTGNKSSYKITILIVPTPETSIIWNFH